MTSRTEVNVKTGEVTVIPLTPQEEIDLQIATDAQNATTAQEVSDLADGTTAETNVTDAWDNDLIGYILNIKDGKALALIMLDEINTLRALHSLADRTPAQVKSAFIAKRKTLL